MTDAPTDADASKDEQARPDEPIRLAARVVETDDGHQCTIYQDSVDEGGQVTR